MAKRFSLVQVMFSKPLTKSSTQTIVTFWLILLLLFSPLTVAKPQRRGTGRERLETSMGEDGKFITSTFTGVVYVGSPHSL
jgi:hypothetical protein